MNEITILPMDIENSIQRFIRKKFEEDSLHEKFQNPLLRQDVLDLLDLYCTVVYYPLEHEGNNGFRIKGIPFADGSQQDFVFINTAQTMEKQVFTAAHELGHIWNVDEFVINELNLDPTQVSRELIINRFAAVLLIPSENFLVSVRTGLKEYGDDENKTITYVNLLKLIVNLMNQFFAPLKAVTLRLVELSIFSEHTAEMLLGYGAISKEHIVKLVNEFIVESGYVQLQNPSNKKWIEGLAEKLDIAEKKNLVPISKINMMREKFGLKASASAAASPEMNDLISLDTQEGLET